MARTPEASINPAVLTWARETVGLYVDKFAQILKVDTKQLLAWEAGSEQPTIARLKTIAAKLKRPLAVYYMAAPPDDRRPTTDFRGLIAEQAGFFSPRLHIELRLAEARRKDALNLLEELEEEPVAFNFMATLAEHPEEVAKRLSCFLNIDNSSFSQYQDAFQARKVWKTAVEDKGVLIFQASGVAVSEMRGFSLSIFPLPVAVVNGKDSPRGQIFSLLHELTHIALRQDGICDFNEDLPRAPDAQRIEVFCNHVAGAVLVPGQQLLQHDVVRHHQTTETWSDDELVTLAKNFQCSREVILRRLLIYNLTTQAFYHHKRRDFQQEYQRLEKSRKDRSFAVPYFRKVINRNGYLFSRLTVASYQRELITGSELSKLLNMKLKHLNDLSHALQA